MPNESQHYEWLICIVVGILFLALGAWCYYKNKDNYVYDPTLRYGGIQNNSTDKIEKIRKFFVENGADLENSIVDRRSFLSCAACVNNWETPADCSYCQSYVRGLQLRRTAV